MIMRKILNHIFSDTGEFVLRTTMAIIFLTFFTTNCLGQTINDTDEARQEIREMDNHQDKLQQERIWRQKNMNRQNEVDNMIMKMKMHDRKVVDDYKHKHLLLTSEYEKKMHKKTYHQNWKQKKRTQRIVGAIVIFSVGYYFGEESHKYSYQKKKWDYDGRDSRK